jgi:hypothetical protein
MTTSNEISDYSETLLEAEETRKGESRQARAHTFGIFTGKGFIRCRINDSRITTASDVTAGIGEMDGNNIPFIGDAVMTVHNVAPFNGGVFVRVNVAWDSPLRFQVMVTFD